VGAEGLECSRRHWSCRERLVAAQCPSLGGWNPSPSGDAFRRLAVRWAGCAPTVAPPTPSRSVTTISCSSPSTASRC
jgi:hypothetical protein